MYKTLGFAFLLSGLFSCQTAPYTDRAQFILVSPSEEAALGVQAYKDTLSKAKLVHAGKEFEMVRRTGQNIAPFADQTLRDRGMGPFPWEFNLIDDPKTINAWCLPGGKVAFYTAIMPVCQTEAGVATVMGHEIGHAIARHGAERMTTQLGIGLVGAILDTGFANSKKENREAILAAYGIGSALGALAYSRTQESEADRIGLILMAKAGYDPRETVAFWKRMQAQSKGGATPELLSTHPSDETRIRNLEKWIPEALQIYQAGKNP